MECGCFSVDQSAFRNLNRIDKTEIYRWIDEEASVDPLKVAKALFQAREAADNRGVGLPVVNRYIRHDVGNDPGGVMNVMQGPSARDFELQWIRRRWRHI